MANVVILKQPLYGSVVWNGVEFEYTPNPDFSGNDTYTYRITDTKGSRVVTNYVNPTNLPPIAKNITVNVLANDLTEVDISQLIDDATNPFNYSAITSIRSNISIGSVRTDGKKIYFIAGYFNTIEYVDYTVSDKQYESSGRITFNITGGINPQDYKGSPYSRFGSLLNRIDSIKPISGGWTSMYAVMTARGPIWDSIDATRYNAMASVVSGSTNANFIKWNSSYLNVQKFNTLNSNVTANSGAWENYRILGDNTYNLIDEAIKRYNSEYNVLLQKNPIWSGNIYNINALSSRFQRMYNNMDSTSTTVAINANNKWDGTELNNVSSNYFNSWSDTYNVLITNGNQAEWDEAFSNFNLLSSDIKKTTDNIENTYVSITSNSGYWKSSELNPISAENFPKWDSTYNKLVLYKNDWDTNNKNIYDYTIDYNNQTSNFKSTYSTYQNTSSKWNVTSLNPFSAENFSKWNSTYNKLVLYGGSWDSNNKNIYDYAVDYYNQTNNFNLTYSIYQNTSSKWNVTSLNPFSAENFPKWNQSYNLINLSSNSWYDSSRVNFVTDYQITSTYKSAYSTVQSKSSNWGHTGFDSYSAGNFPKWNSLYKTITANISSWGNFTYTDLTSFSASYFKDTPYYTGAYNTYNSYSYRWGHTTFDTYSAKNFPRWDNIASAILKINNTKTSLSTFSADYFNNVLIFNDLYSTSYTKSSTNWSLAFVPVISGYITIFDEAYDTLIAVSDNTDKWDSSYNSSNLFNDVYLSAASNFDKATYRVNQDIAFWNDNSASQILTAKSDYWNSTYSSVCGISSDWFFKESSPLISVQTATTAKSAEWNISKQQIASSNNKWLNTNSLVSSTSSNYLTGNNAITLSAKDIYIYGDTLIKGNLSALGKRIKVNTSLYTISGFSITNSGTTDAFNINKNGGFDKAVVNFDTLSSTVMYVKTTSSVGINVSAFPSTNALTVSGNISASGFIYPLHNAVSTYQSNSGKYESTYNYITGISSNFYSVCALSANYNKTVSYITLTGTKLTSAKNNQVLYNTMNSSTQTNSGYNNYINNFITLSSPYFDADVEYQNKKLKYDNLYNAVTTLSSDVRYYDINILFSYLKSVNSNKINYTVQENININSWTMVSDVVTTSEIVILTATQANYPTMTDITNNINRPHLDGTNTSGKNFNNNLRFWTGTRIPADTILQFMLTNNSTASSIMISLKVNKL